MGSSPVVNLVRSCMESYLGLISIAPTLLISGRHFNSTGGVEITPLRRVKKYGVKSTPKVELKLLYFGMHFNFYSTRSKFNSTKGVKITLPEE